MTPYQASLDLIEIRIAPRGTALVRLVNAQAWRDKFAALKPLKPKGIIAARVSDPRKYPRFYAGVTTTRDYVAEFVRLNRVLLSSFCAGGSTLPECEHWCANYDEPAPSLDPREPEVLHETIDEGLTP
jgi:hypothetical protein